MIVYVVIVCFVLCDAVCSDAWRWLLLRLLELHCAPVFAVVCVLALT